MIARAISILAIRALSTGGILQSPATVLVHTDADSVAIRHASLNYIEGWYTTDAERMSRALHPDLRKRMIYTHPKTEADSLDRRTAQTLIQSTRTREPTPASQRRTEVAILSIYKDAAVVRVDAQKWVDYLHVAEWRGD